MAWLCIFVHHRWVFRFNTEHCGVYQCTRCKEISTGSLR